MGRFDKAIWAINKYVEIAPDEPNAYDSRGEILAMNGKLDEAIASYEQAIKLQPDFSRFPLANLYIQREDFAKADSLLRAIASDANERTRAEGRLALTRIPRYQGKFEEALSLLETGIATDRMELGECSESAEKLFMRVLINEFLGNRHSLNEDLREAIRIAEKREARNLYTGLYRAYLVAVLRASGDQSGSDSLMLDIASTITGTGFPDSVAYWLTSAFTHFKLEQYDTAALFWERLLKLDPYHFPSLLYLGMSYLGSNQLGSAVSVLEKASNVYDGTRGGTAGMGVQCHYYLGKAYEASGWTGKAIEQYETFLDIWKDADEGLESVEDAKQRLARLKADS
jgi:tetratricopeptide (TPR) repeat protein